MFTEDIRKGPKKEESVATVNTDLCVLEWVVAVIIKNNEICGF
jgi:hypothetical protein